MSFALSVLGLPIEYAILGLAGKYRNPYKLNAYFWILLPFLAPCLWANITEEDSIMYYLPLMVNHAGKLVTRLDNATVFCPHLYESLCAPFVKLPGFAYFPAALNTCVLLSLASRWPAVLATGYLAFLGITAKADMLTLYLFAEALRAGGARTGMLTGAIYGVKMTAGPFLLPLLAVRWRKAWPWALLFAAPWMASAYVLIGNPLFPMLSRSLNIASPAWIPETAKVHAAMYGAINYRMFFYNLLFISPMIVFIWRSKAAMLMMACALVLSPAVNRYFIFIAIPLAVYIPFPEWYKRIVFVAGLLFVVNFGWGNMHKTAVNHWTHVLPMLKSDRTLCIGEGRKWHPVYRPDVIAQSTLDIPVMWRAVKESWTTAEVHKKLARQMGIRRILYNPTSLYRWARCGAEYRWSLRMLDTLDDYMGRHARVLYYDDVFDVAGQYILYQIDNFPYAHHKVLPGVEGEKYLLGIERARDAMEKRYPYSPVVH